jgi:hypothetical protein
MSLAGQESVLFMLAHNKSSNWTRPKRKQKTDKVHVL